MEQKPFEPTSRIIEIEVPNDSAIFPYKGAIKSGLESLENAKRLFVMAGERDTIMRLDNAINAMTAFLQTVCEVEDDIITEFQQAQQKAPQQAVAGFVPRLEPEEE